jgi:DNA invertase Pin-like site-specific DNA recombinase
MAGKPTIRCAIYTRKSTEEGLEQAFNSLDAQREACEAYITSQKAEGWIALPSRYDDGGYSGGTLERPALQHLMRDIEQGRVDVVVVYKIDRLSRSLMDFARLVELFDRRSVTFVSVTQAFNTTTSMGRLTLNVLLSFAQFEREVIGERIRDKFAASRRKGMWMGGNIPLGYDLEARKLVINETEAGTVRLIFQRYLDLGRVRALRDDLKQRGIRPKQWASSTGATRGGHSFERGGLYHLLRNRLYRGEILYKGVVYPGEHKAIVPADLFDAVQQRLADNRQRRPGKPGTSQDAPLANRLIDSEGAVMAATYSLKKGGRRYRYYVSRTKPNTAKLNMTRAAITRVPAPPLEQLIDATLLRLGLPKTANSHAVLQRVQIGASSIVLSLDKAAALEIWQTQAAEPLDDRQTQAHCRSHLATGETLMDHGATLIVTLPVWAEFRGGRAGISQTGQDRQARTPDPALLKALARAHRWKALLLSGEIRSIEELAIRIGQERRHVGRTLSLAFLNPALARQILRGEQPASLRLSTLLDADIPLSWQQQDQLFGTAQQAQKIP